MEEKDNGGDPKPFPSGPDKAAGKDNGGKVPPTTPAAKSTMRATSDDGDAHPKPPSKVTLGDVQNAFPAESSEERIVMEHIERTDPTKGDNERWETTAGGNRIYKAPTGLTAAATGTSERSLLDQATSLPPELVATMQEEKVQQMMEGEQKASLERAKSRRGRHLSHQAGFYRKNGGGLENELFELTNMLRPGQSGDFEKNDDGDTIDNEDNQSEQQTSDEERQPLTQAETFAASAAGMFQHLSRKVEMRYPSFPGAASFNRSRRDSKSGEGGAESDGEKSNQSSSRPSRHSSMHKQLNGAMQNMKEVERIIQQGRKSIMQYARNVFLFIILPCTGIACLLYYALGNPGAEIIYLPNPNANATDPDSKIRVVGNSQPSYSWLFLFFGVRQVITFGLAVGLQHLTVTYYQQAGLQFTFVGPLARLLIIQAKV